MCVICLVVCVYCPGLILLQDADFKPLVDAVKDAGKRLLGFMLRKVVQKI